jgi:hypothetical protein
LFDLAADATGETCILVSGLTRDEAVSLRFNKRALPYFTVWRNTPAVNDGYVIGIEPGTNYPNPRTFEQQHNRIVQLKPGERWSAKVTATWHQDRAAIEADEQSIDALRGARKPELSAQPRQDWTAGA